MTTKKEAKEQHPEPCSGEAFAAISMALYEHLDADVHDIENMIITIVRRTYSPWNLKICTMREAPQRRMR